MTEVPLWEPDWAVYTNVADGQTQIVHVDLGLDFPLEQLMEELPSLMHLRLRLPEESATEAREKADEDLDQAVECMLGHQCVFAGRRDANGQTHLFFYGENEQALEEAAKECMPGIEAYEADYVIREEPEWVTYRNTLLPDELTEKTIYTDQTLATLKEEGYDMNETREVDHFVFFGSEGERDAAAEQIKDKGYGITKIQYYDEEDFADIQALSKELESEEEEQNPPGLRLTHRIALGDPKLYDHVKEIYAVVEQHDGFYDYWGINEEE